MRIHVHNIPETKLPLTAEGLASALPEYPALQGARFTFSSAPAEFEPLARDADILLTWPAVLQVPEHRQVVSNCADLRFIYCNATGIDRLMPLDWLPPQVVLANNSGVQFRKAGEFAVMALLMLQNKSYQHFHSQWKQQWNEAFGNSLAGRTLAVVGLGSIGSEVARHGRHFDMRVIGVRHGGGAHPACHETVSFREIERILPQVDDLVLCCPLTNDSRNLLSRERIALLRPGTRLVNLARGAVWDQEAVCDGLDAGLLDAVFTDVAVPEPLPLEHRLWTTRNLLVTPHIAAEDEAHHNVNTFRMFLRNVDAWRQGHAVPNAVDRRKGY